MSSELILGVRLDLQTLTTIKLSDINFKTKVAELKYETAGRVNLSKELFELIYCGCVLEDDMTLESYGLKNGAMIHVLRKREPELPSFPKYISEDGILQLVSAFKSFKENPGLRSALRKKPEVMDNIISSSPGLHEDTVAIAILQDPDLMSYFTDVDTVRRFAEAHPVLVEAAQNIAAAVHAEAHNNITFGINSSLSNSESAAFSYSLDNLSGDEEMAGDSSQSSDSTQPSNLSSNPTNSTVTVAQLAAAVSRARAGSFPLSDSSSSTSASSANSRIITAEMFTQAMQQVHSPLVLPRPSNLRRMLAQMHELGLQNDRVNRRALRLTNHDLRAAIELVLSGLINN
ncbi:ubiquitin-like protein 7 isoform X2 [Apis laboriosa]|uniref:ubiquitin-like protein 7 isoform X2 n=1 Tax=Apis laboriosa TaxID=183418 RepID=UPI0003DF4C69|nr:ubiquitin-like protein 7 isoform X2 [Apis laboriosa]